MKALTTHLSWSPVEAVEAASEVQRIISHPGLDAIMSAIEQRKAAVLDELTQMQPSDESAAYADKLGQLRALGELPLIVQGILENGRAAEHKLRQQESRET